MKSDKAVIYSLTALAIVAQGLYFTEQWLVGLVIIGLLLSIRVFRQKTFRVPKTFTFLMLLLYAVAHLVGYGVFLERGMLIFGLLKSIMYVLFYLLLVQYEVEKLTKEIKVAFVACMVLCGIVTSVLFMTGWLTSLRYIIDNRLAGPLQYANTYGILLLAAMLMLMQMKVKPWIHYLGLIGLMTPLILTMSRANYIIALVMVVATLILTDVKKATYLPVLTSIVVGVIILLVFDSSDTSTRISEVGGASEWHSRLLYYKDSLNMLVSRPIGYGPNGYHYAQSFYQTGSTYHVKFVHSGLLQSFLDTGIFGGLAVSLLMFYVVFLGRHRMAERLILTALFGHSLIDMDLQFPIVWLLVVVLFADQALHDTYEVKKVWPLMLGCLLIVVIGGVMFRPALLYSNRDYEEAIRAYPYYTEAYRQLLKDEDYKPSLVPYAVKLEEMNPYVTEGYPILRDDAVAQGAYEKAVDYGREMVYYSPLRIENHEQYSHVLMLAATYWHAYDEDDKALDVLKEILQFPEVLQKLAKEMDTDYNVKHKPNLEMNRALMKDYVEANYLMDKILEK